MRLYDGADIECLFTLSTVEVHQVSQVQAFLENQGFTVTGCWHLSDDTEYELLATLDPVSGAQTSLANPGAHFGIYWEGKLAGDHADFSTSFDVSTNSFACSYGNESLTVVGGAYPSDRLLSYLQTLEALAQILHPLYCYVGPEFYHHSDMALENVHRRGVEPYTSEMFGRLNAEEIGRFYGF